MASKKFKGKTCVYCAKTVSTTEDHVVARQFFLPGAAQNTPKVPACQPCNTKKSALEGYLVALLPFGGRHKDASETLELVPNRLEKNRRLARELAQGRGERLIRTAEGETRPHMTLPFKREKFIELCSLIVKGLVWHHWRTLISDKHAVRCVMCSPLGYEVVNSTFFRKRARNCVSENLGDGTFTYTGIQGVDDPQLTLWWLDFYGGVQFGGDPVSPDGSSSVTLGVSGSRNLVEGIVKDLFDEEYTGRPWRFVGR